MGTALIFDKNTVGGVREVLQRAYDDNQRIRIFLGDPVSGQDWIEENDIMGYVVGFFTGKTPVILLVRNRNSSGGEAIMDSHIVKITINKVVAYQHPNYHLRGELTYKKDDGDNFEWGVFCKGDNIANFVTEIEAMNYIDFLKGFRNSIR